jgi:hypothetical protein
VARVGARPSSFQQMAITAARSRPAIQNPVGGVLPAVDGAFTAAGVVAGGEVVVDDGGGTARPGDGAVGVVTKGVTTGGGGVDTGSVGMGVADGPVVGGTVAGGPDGVGDASGSV